jgi:membrane carboxypeptidase/penicillin-binding protein PbpC
VTLREALASSLNVPAVRTLGVVGCSAPVSHQAGGLLMAQRGTGDEHAS